MKLDWVEKYEIETVFEHERFGQRQLLERRKVEPHCEEMETKIIIKICSTYTKYLDFFINSFKTTSFWTGDLFENLF